LDIRDTVHQPLANEVGDPVESGAAPTTHKTDERVARLSSLAIALSTMLRLGDSR
jgi:hypothetical protein